MEDVVGKVSQIDKTVAVLKEATKYHQLETKNKHIELEKDLIALQSRIAKAENDVITIKAFQAKLGGAAIILSLVWQYASDKLKFPG
jgi:uncharacterized membrane protein YfbV (UPF0208 family)